MMTLGRSDSHVQDDTLPVEILIEEAEVDRKLLGLRASARRQGSVHPNPPSKGGGGWKTVKSYLHRLPRDAKFVEVLIQAEQLVWSSAEPVYSNSVSWKEMLYATNTHKKIVISPGQVELGEAVSATWFGTTKNHADRLNGQKITGAFKFNEVYDKDGEFTTSCISFTLTAVVSDSNGSQ